MGRPLVMSRLGWKGAVLAAIALVAVGGVGALGLWAISFARSNTRVQVPDDLALSSPAAEIPRSSAVFAGLWGGDRWDGGPVPHALAVEHIEADGTASVVYAWGSDLVAHRLRGWARVQGKIADGHLTFELPDDRALDYNLGADGRLLGRETDRTDWRSYVLLRRATAADRAAGIAAATERSDPLWEEISVPERAMVGAAAGQTISLRATLYRTLLPGRQKLIVLNHGSTVGTTPERTLRYEPQARVFLAMGYSVAIPMRKGRGGSGGPLLESDNFESPPTPAQIDSGLEDIDAAIEYFRAQDFVDPDGIVIAGEGRGGLLSVAYAGRYPGRVKSVVNFSGAWWPESYRDGAINTEEFGAAGGAAGIPMLWFYAEGDSYSPIAHVQRNLRAFKAAGGTAELVLLPDLREPKTYDNRVLQWTGKWDDAVRAFLTRDARAPAAAGLTLFDIPDPLDREETMPVAVFYPTRATRGVTNVTDWIIDAMRDAPPAEGRFPVILLSHGDGGHRLAHHDIAVALARAGFMVIAPTHPGDHVPERDAWRRDRVLVGREYDMRAALDAVLADPVLGAHADAARIGAAGFSLGGYTALLLAGARPDFARFVPYCEDSAIADPTCAENPEPPEIRAGLDVFRDPRVKSVFLMAPAPGYFFTAEGLRDVRVPVHIDDPEEDEVTKRPYDAERIRDLLPVPPEYAMPARAGHYIYLAPCPDGMRKSNPAICRDHPGVDRVAFHATLVAEMVEFFRRTLGTP
jgi:predicted dienelactone hydrolase